MYVKWLSKRDGSRVAVSLLRTLILPGDSLDSLKRKIRDQGWEYVDFLMSLDDCCQYELDLMDIRNTVNSSTHPTRISLKS